VKATIPAPKNINRPIKTMGRRVKPNVKMPLSTNCPPSYNHLGLQSRYGDL
jgi:hypothetical protein